MKKQQQQYGFTNMQCLPIYSMPSILIFSPNTFDVLKTKKKIFLLWLLSILLQCPRFFFHGKQLLLIVFRKIIITMKYIDLKGNRMGFIRAVKSDSYKKMNEFRSHSY